MTKRMDLKMVRHRRKGMWRMTKFGKKFMPACVLDRCYKMYCLPITRKFILWEAKEMLCH